MRLLWLLQIWSCLSSSREFDLAKRIFRGWGVRSKLLVAEYIQLNDAQQVTHIRANKGGLRGRIPPQIGNLTSLRSLSLHLNHLTGPIPPQIGQLKQLTVLDLSMNELTGTVPQEITSLPALKQVSLFQNRLSGSLPALGNMRSLERIVLSENRFTGDLTGRIPDGSLSWLDLGDNQLSGELPEVICKSSKLYGLILHRNAFSGQIPPCVAQLEHVHRIFLHENNFEGHLPDHWSCAPILESLTLHSNRFSGPPPIGLWDMTKLRDLTMHGNRFTGTVPQIQLVQGGRATLHDNRFSCAVPSGLGAAGVTVTVVMGNMVGVGADISAEWVPDEEKQDFLYYSDKVWRSFMQVTLFCCLAIVCSALQYPHFRHLSQASGHCSQAAAVTTSSLDAFWLSSWVACLCAPLLLAYLWGARYYYCGQPLARVTASYLDDSPVAESLVTLVWSLLAVFCSMAIQILPQPRHVPRSLSGGGGCVYCCQRVLFWFLWIALVSLVSLPSILYAVAEALPKNNLLVSDSILTIAHRTAPMCIVLVDMVLATKMSTVFSGLSGIREDTLLMTFRLCSAWLLPMVTTILLQEHCFAGWKHWWQPCSPEDVANQRYNWIIHADLPILNTTRDMCQMDIRNFLDGGCTRSVIEGLGPLVLKKLLLRIFLQPLITFLVWKASKLEEEPVSSHELGRHLLFLNVVKTSRSLIPLRQRTYLTTLVEVAIVWGPLLPLVSFGIVATIMVNLLLFHKGLSFGVQLPTNADNQGVSLSQPYLRVALSASWAFQVWHAFGCEMHGRWLLPLSMAFAVAVALLPPLRPLPHFLARYLRPDVEWELPGEGSEMIRVSG